MRKKDIAPFFETLRAANPLPTTELEFTTPFELLVAVVLSAQATDASVNKATRQLFPVANTPWLMLELGVPSLEGYIKSIGLYRTKAKNLVEASRMLIQNHDGVVPRTRRELEALPGVGPKTASVVLNVVFGDETVAVDTHVFRVANRTGLARGKDPLAVEKILLKVIPADFLVDAHHWLILHGRYVCVARRPRCWECSVAKYCAYEPKTPRPQAPKPVRGPASRRLPN